MSSRAERRRAAREKKWEPHDPAKHQSLPDIAHRINQHNLMCERCRSGNVVKRGCPGLDNLYRSHADEIRKLLGMEEEIADAPVHHVTVGEDGSLEVAEGDDHVGAPVSDLPEASSTDS